MPNRGKTMTNFTIGRWLLVAVAIAGLALAIPVVSAHGTDAPADDVAPYDGTADEWATWMETQMNEHMGPGSVEWMESQMGLTVEEMGQDMAGGDYNGGMYGQGHC